MTASKTIGWPAVEEACETAKCIAFDGCHKIYVAMDDTQAAWFLANYSLVIKAPVRLMIEQVREWYEASCSLKMVDSVSTNEENPNAGYVSLIPQSYDPDAERWM